jgi:hypothetical protein
MPAINPLPGRAGEAGLHHVYEFFRVPDLPGLGLDINEGALKGRRVHAQLFT